MNSVWKKCMLAVVICGCVGTYHCYDVRAQAVNATGMEAKETILPLPGGGDGAGDSFMKQKEMEMEPMVGLPSPMREFNTVDEAARYMGFEPHLPKVLPVGYNIESVTTINKDILQIIYVYQPGEDLTRNQANGMRINYRVAPGTGDISGDHNEYKVVNKESVNGAKVTFKGAHVMVRSALWEQDGQTHAIYFERSVTRDMAKAIISNVKAQTSHAASGAHK